MPPTPKDAMDDIYTAQQLIDELRQLPPHAPVMITVVKYPAEFGLKPDASTGSMRWDMGDDVETLPLELGEVTVQDGLIYFTVELADFDEARREHLQS